MTLAFSHTPALLCTNKQRPRAISNTTKEKTQIHIVGFSCDVKHNLNEILYIFTVLKFVAYGHHLSSITQCPTPHREPQYLLRFLKYIQPLPTMTPA